MHRSLVDMSTPHGPTRREGREGIGLAKRCPVAHPANCHQDWPTVKVATRPVSDAKLKCTFLPYAVLLGAVLDSSELTYHLCIIDPHV